MSVRPHLRSPLRHVRRPAVVLPLTATAVLAFAGVASAHVTVHSYEPAVQGSYGALVFRVPAEESTNTVKLTVAFPAALPFAQVSTLQKPGWTVAETMGRPATALKDDDGDPVDSVVTSVTWTATSGGGIAPGSYDEFDLSVGPFPKVASMAFQAVQTYANGDVVRWIEPTPPGGQEPDHPAPVLKLVAAGSGDGTATAATTTDGATVSGVTAGSTTQATSSSDTGARDLGIVGIVVGALGLGLGGAALLRSRRVAA